MSLNLLSAMSAAEEPYNPLDKRYKQFRPPLARGSARYRPPTKGPQNRERTPEEQWDREERTPDGPWDREEEEHNAYERRRIYEEEQAKTRDDERGVAGASVKMKNKSFQGDVKLRSK